MSTNGANDTPHSNKNSAATPKGEKAQEYDLPALKQRVGSSPFRKRIKVDSEGFSACPFHNGDGDKAFHLVEKEDGCVVGTCFSTCSKTFDAIDFVKKFDGVTTGQAIRTLVADGGSEKDSLHKTKLALPMTAETWAKSGRPVTDTDVAKLAASRPGSATPSAATLNAMGFRMTEMGGKPLLVAPYRLGNTFYTLKVRNVTSKEFFQENAVSQQGLFNIDAVTKGCDVTIVESELDAAILHEAGEIAVSVINAKQKSLELEIMNKLTTARRIFLVGDQDTPGQTCMDNLAKILPANKTYRISFTDAKDVGELAQAAKKTEAILGPFQEQWQALKSDSMVSWVALNIPFVSQLSSEPQKWVIDRLLPLSGYLLVTGKFGGQKSLSALYMAAGIESGASVFGRKVLHKTPVLYVDRENPQATVGERRFRLGIPDNLIRYWGDWIEGMETPNLDDPRLEEFAIREKGVIIFDSLTDWLEGESENDPSKMTEVARKFRRLARLGAGVIVLHHDNKNGIGYRGTTAIPAGSDMAIKMEKNENTGVVEIRTERFRMCASWEIDFRFNFGDRYTLQVLKDKLSGDSHKAEAADEMEIVTGVLSTYHEENDGKPMNQIQLKSALQAVGVSKAKAVAILAKGVQEKKWRFETGKQNALLYSLVGWQPSADKT